MNFSPWSWGTEKLFSRPSWQPFKRHRATWDAQARNEWLASWEVWLASFDGFGIILGIFFFWDFFNRTIFFTGYKLGMQWDKQT